MEEALPLLDSNFTATPSLIKDSTGSLQSILLILDVIGDDEELILLKNSISARKSSLGGLKAAYNLNLEAWYLNPMVFKQNFRMLPSTLEQLIVIMGRELSAGIRRRPKVDVKLQVLLSVWILANQESFRGVSQRFGLEKGHSYVVFKRFVLILFSSRGKFITLSSGIRQAARGFEVLRQTSLPGTVGAIDGCQIPIKAPKNDKPSYFNRKHHYSVNLQAVCGHRKLFVDVFAGWPGSSHDSRVFRKSPIFKFLEENGLSRETHLIGDSGYPLRNYLLVPYKDNGNLSPMQKNFNRILSSNRSVIEQAFGLLLSRFRRLKYLDMSKVELIPKVIMVACILHNICLLSNDFVELSQEIQPRFDAHTSMDSSIEGTRKREEIARRLVE